MADKTVPALDASRVRSILVTDGGSTTTKAILIEKQPDGVFRLVTRGEAPTTVEGGVVGLFVDCRGRPIALPPDDTARLSKLREWLAALGLGTGK